MNTSYILLKSILSPFFLIICLLSFAIVLLIIKRKVAIAKFILITALSILFLSSFRPFSNYLLWGLEKQYIPLENFDKLQKINYIVVLTAWANNDPTVPYTSHLGYTSAFRVLEAHRIYVNMPGRKILITGDWDSTQAMNKFFLILGVPREQIILEDESKTTMASALNIKKLIPGDQFILVTSALHLPRAMKSFMSQNLKPLPAPADFLYGNYKEFQFPVDRQLAYYIPNIDSFFNTNMALYEYLGLLWYSIKY